MGYQKHTLRLFNAGYHKRQYYRTDLSLSSNTVTASWMNFSTYYILNAKQFFLFDIEHN